MIKIENLTKSYRTPTGRHYVFKDLNLEIPSGKSVAFIGRNGAGKSTLLRMIGGIDRPDSGKIDPAMVAKQMELVLEGCLSRMLVNRSQADVDTAHRLAEDILRFARCRQGGALT